MGPLSGGYRTSLESGQARNLDLRRNGPNLVNDRWHWEVRLTNRTGRELTLWVEYVCLRVDPEVSCGDGIINQDTEVCDDGNAANGDGCSDTCQVEDGLRLVDGEVEGFGRLEIWHDGEWGTVCDDFFDLDNAEVACKQLGYRGAIAEDLNPIAGEGRIWLDNVQCLGTEERLADCRRNDWGNHNCGHHEDVTVTCATGVGEAGAECRLPRHCESGLTCADGACAAP